MLQLSGKESHQPSKYTGQCCNEDSQEKEYQYLIQEGRKNRYYPRTAADPEHSHSWNEHHAFIQQPQKEHYHHPAYEDPGRRDRQRQQHFIVFCLVEHGVGVEHISKHSQCKSQHSHDCKVEPAKATGNERTQTKAHAGDHSHHDDNQEHKEKDEGYGLSFAISLSRLLVDEIGSEKVLHLLLYQKLDHITPPAQGILTQGSCLP